ncbi:MAG: FAD-dependent thymidylate synthase [Bacilli bacterium]|nr:FAD-dependent thymidylate synthase [Bacilli bacterium]
MRYVKQSFEEISIDDFYCKIALVAHNCYQVNKDKNQKIFVNRLLGFKHYAMIEHKVFVAKIDSNTYRQLIDLYNRFIVLATNNDDFYCAFSLRPLLEAYESNNLGILADLINILPSDVQEIFADFHMGKTTSRLLSAEEIDRLPRTVYDKVKYVTIKLITDRGVSHELVRHRIASYAQESTRYCNYAKDKFSNELTLIEPLDYQENKAVYDCVFGQIEQKYIELVNRNVAPEMARALLPNKLKTSIIITANVQEYKNIFALRCDQRAHPDIRDIMIPLRDYFVAKNYLVKA